MKIKLRRLVFAAAAAAAAQALAATPGRAGVYGDEPWCAVHDEGGGVVNFDCEFASVDDCSPAIIAGNKGFCQRNPYWQPPETEPQSLMPPPPPPPTRRN